MGGTETRRAAYYRPAEVAEILRCSEWWVKEQARRRRIPYAWIGGSYLFTDEHIAAILRLFEVQPDQPGEPTRSVATVRVRDAGSQSAGSALVARVPRRARLARNDAA